MDINGKITHCNGVRVLTTWGSHKDMGFAHGYLLAREIIDGAKEILSLDAGSGAVQSMLTPIRRACRERLIAPSWALWEAEGLYQGICAALSAKDRFIKGLGRKIDRLDIWALNTYSEWCGMGCSSLSAWGDLTENRNVLLARNLDYMPFNTCLNNHILIARKPRNGRRWLSFAWPGLLGCYTGFSDAGVAAMVHDAWSVGQQRYDRFMSRQIVFQEIITKLNSNGTLKQQAVKLLRNRPAIRGSSVHVANRKGGFVIEYDENYAQDEGATLREPTPNNSWIACTNSFFARATQPCARYESLERDMNTVAANRYSITGLNLWDMWDLINTISSCITLHTVVVNMNTLDMLVGLARPDVAASEREPALLTWKDVWEGSLADITAVRFPEDKRRGNLPADLKPGQSHATDIDALIEKWHGGDNMDNFGQDEFQWDVLGKRKAAKTCSGRE